MGIILEKYETISGRLVTRVRSEVFYWTGFILFILSIFLLHNAYWKAAIILALTIVPILLLYPLVRFLFGGKDSLVAAIGTIVVEEAIKHTISKKINNKKNNRKY